MEREKLKNIYECLFKDEVRKDEMEPPAAVVTLTHFLSSDKNPIILEAGCGDGRNLYLLSRMGYENLFGVDIIDHTNMEGVSYQQCSIDNLPAEWTGKFDCILCAAVIYFLDDPKQGLKEFRRCLKENGILVLTAHTKYSVFSLIRKVKMWLGFQSMSHLKGCHWDRDVEEYISMAESLDMKILYRSGFRTSYIYHKFSTISDRILKRFGYRFPVIRFRVNLPEFWNNFKSKHAYYSILVCHKGQ